MTDDDKKNRWAKSLDEAGLLDEVEDAWELKTDPKDGSTITVEEKKSSEKDEQAVVHSDSVPFAIPVPSILPNDITDEDPDLTPVVETYPEIEENKYTAPSAKGTVRNMGGPGSLPLKIERKTNKQILEAKRTSDYPFLEEGPVVEVRGKRISVAPESVSSRIPVPRKPILDDPPDVDAVFADIDVGSPTDPLHDAADYDDVVVSVTSDPLGIVESVSEAPEPIIDMRDRREAGDYSGALEIANEIMANNPAHEEAIACREESEAILLQMFESKIGPMDVVPRLAISSEEIIWRNLDQRSGFIVSQIDGLVTFEDILDISGMSKFDTCKILNDLIQDGVIE